MYSALSTPRISYGRLKLHVSGGASVPSRVVHAVPWVGVPGVGAAGEYPGWGIPGGYYPALPTRYTTLVLPGPNPLAQMLAGLVHGLCLASCQPPYAHASYPLRSPPQDQ